MSLFVLKDLAPDDRKTIGADIMAIEMSWPIGYPAVRKLDSNLWEVRSNISDKRISRVFFTILEGNMINYKEKPKNSARGYKFE